MMKIQEGFSSNTPGTFSREKIRLCGSWMWCREGFCSDFEKLRTTDLLSEKGPSTMIWSTKQKFVLKVHTPEGRVIAYKAYRYFKHACPYFFRACPTGLEALNYALMEELGIPMARLLAVGETRKFFVIKTAFLVTEFVADSLDGTAFLPGGKYEQNKEYLREFCLKNLVYLAMLHNHGVIHNGSAPYNMLWKEKETALQKEGDRLDIVWIDVATCRKKPFGRKFMRQVSKDLAKFLDPFSFSAEEKKFMLEHYCSHAVYGKEKDLLDTVKAELL